MGKQNLFIMLEKMTDLLDKSMEAKGLVRCSLGMQMLQMIQDMRNEINKLEVKEEEQKEADKHGV